MGKINKNFVKRKIYHLLPKLAQLRLLKYLLPEMEMDIDDISFRTASTPNEYLAAFNLVYKVFLHRGFTRPSTTPFRLAPQHCNPDSRVFIGVHNDNSAERLIYSISLFTDSSKGLPMDDVFKPQLDKLRSRDRFVVEVGHLAADPSFKMNTMNIPMLGNKMVHHYAYNVLNADDIVLTTHPRYQWIYEDLLLFEKIGEISEYGYANGNPAIALRLDLRTVKQRYQQTYQNFSKKINVHDFFFVRHSNSMTLPVKKPVETQVIESMETLYGIQLKGKKESIHYEPMNYKGQIQIDPVLNPV